MFRDYMKWNKKRIFLLLLLQCSLLYCQPTSTIQSNLTSIEDFAINIENNSLQQKMQIESLQKQLKNAKISQEALENSVIEMSNQVETLLKSQKSLEQKCMNLKIALGVSVSLSIISITTLIIMMNN